LFKPFHISAKFDVFLPYFLRTGCGSKNILFTNQLVPLQSKERQNIHTFPLKIHVLKNVFQFYSNAIIVKIQNKWSTRKSHDEAAMPNSVVC